ncbi:MAG: hypothetical protein HIU92_16310 [Proteobacteria bacterium]|nr:hypothetical protein [Pseudomonadota bacterium]
MKVRKLLPMAALATLMVAGEALAEPVRVTVAGDRSGEGWLYSKGNDCFVLTPRHVLFIDGRMQSPMLVDASGVTGAGIEPEAPSILVGGSPMDVARVRVVGALTKKCSDGLGYDDLSATLERIIGTRDPIYFEKVGRSGSSEEVPAQIVAINKDRARFTIRTVDPESDPIRESDSGSTVRLRGTSVSEIGLPLGLVLRDEGGGYISVLRLDAVRGWLDTLVAARSAQADLLSSKLIGWSAATPDPTCGPTNLFDAKTPCGWRPKLRPGASSIDVDLLIASSGSAPLGGLTITLEKGSQFEDVEVLMSDTVAGGETWQSIRYCPMVGAELVQSCTFLPRIGQTVRLRFSKLAGGIRNIILHQ